jgi:hypothetical protein
MRAFQVQQFGVASLVHPPDPFFLVPVKIVSIRIKRIKKFLLACTQSSLLMAAVLFTRLRHNQSPSAFARLLPEIFKSILDMTLPTLPEE